MYRDIDLSAFPPDREQRLKSIYRYSMFEQMFYRPNLWQHQFRVLWMTEKLLPLAGQYFPALDPEKARILAIVHDDAEMITGDIQAGHKARMSPDELQKVEQEEIIAVETLMRGYPDTIHGYSYRDLLMHAAKKDCIEAMVVSYADKLEGLCESMHELLAGNYSFLRSFMFYVDHIRATLPNKYPQLREFLSDKSSPLANIMDVLSPEQSLAARSAQFGAPHTEQSLQIETDFPFYNEWRKTILERGGSDGAKQLLLTK